MSLLHLHLVNFHQSFLETYGKFRIEYHKTREQHRLAPPVTLTHNEMVSYTVWDVLLDCFACAAIVSASAVSALSWHPLLKDVRDSCKAGIAHPDRDRLLQLVGLTPTAWGLAFAMYARNVHALWSIMVESPKKHFGQRIRYTLLDFYLSLISLLGCIGVIVTIYFICTRWQDIKDLRMIIRFNSEDHRQRQDLELQSLPHGEIQSPNVATAPTSGGTASSSNRSDFTRSHERNPRGSHVLQTGRVSPQSHVRRPVPIWNHFRKSAYYMEPRDYRRAATDSDGDEVIDTPPSASQAEAVDNSRRLSADSVGKPPSLISDHGSEDVEMVRDASPRPPHPQSDNVDGLEECPLHRCSSCSASHTLNFPRTTRAAVREPLTPTSPTKDYGHSAMWSRIFPIQSGVVQANGAGPQQVLFGGFGNRLIESNDSGATPNPSGLGDELQVGAERYERAPIGRSETSVTTPYAMPARTESVTEDERKARWDREFKGLRSMGFDPEKFIEAADEELAQEAANEYEEYLKRRRSRLQNQQMLRAADRGQAVSATLALRNGIPIPGGPTGQPVYRRLASHTPVETLSSPSSTVKIDSIPSPPLESHYNLRPTRVMADPRTVQLGGIDGPPTVARVASPRLRLETPGSSSAAHGRAAAPVAEHSRRR